MTYYEKILETFKYVRDEIQNQFKKMTEHTLFTSAYSKRQIANDFSDSTKELGYELINEQKLYGRIYFIIRAVADFIRGFGSIVIIHNDFTIETLFSSLCRQQDLECDIIDIFSKLDHKLKQADIRTYYVNNIISPERYMKFIHIPTAKYYVDTPYKWLREKEKTYNYIYQWLHTVKEEAMLPVIKFFDLYTDKDYIEFFENRTVNMQIKYETIKDLYNLYTSYKMGSYAPSRYIWYYLDKFLKNRNPYFKNFMAKFYEVNDTNIVNIFLPRSYSPDIKNKLIPALNSLSKEELQDFVLEMINKEVFETNSTPLHRYNFEFTIIDYMCMSMTLLKRIYNTYPAIPKCILKVREIMHDDSTNKKHLINLITTQLKDKTVDELKQIAYKG